MQTTQWTLLLCTIEQYLTIVQTLRCAMLVFPAHAKNKRLGHKLVSYLLHVIGNEYKTLALLFYGTQYAMPK